MKRKYAKIAIAFAVAAATATTPVVSVLASEEAVVTSGEAIDGAMVTSGEEKPTSDAVATLKVNFTDEFGNTLGIEPVVATKTGPEGETAVFKYGEDWQIPEGYTFASANDESYAKQDLAVKFGETLDTLTIAIVKEEQPTPDAVATLKVNFTDEFGNTLGVEPAVATKTGPEGETAVFKYGEDWQIPEGYTFASANDESYAKQDLAVKFGETLDTLTIAIVKEEQPTPDAVATLKVNFTDEFGNTLGVEPAVATKTGPEGETAVFKYGEDWQIPEGYTFASANDESYAKQDLMVKFGETLDTLVIAIVEQPTSQTIGVNYWDAENNVQAGEGKVTVAADAYKVNTSALTDIPEGYELVNTGDIEINDGWIYVEVKKAATTKEIGVNYWDTENNVQAGEGKVTVAADAYKVNTSALTDIPEGYELVNTGDIEINDGWIYVEVKKAATTKEVGVNYYIPAEDRYVEGKVTVAADSIHVNTSVLTDIPAGYEVVWTGDVLIYDNWIYVELRKSETVKEIGVNYYIPAEDRYVEGKVIVDKDANNVNTSALTDIPAGYEPIWVGDVQINDGWIYVELRKSETVKEISVKYYIPAEHRYLKGKVIVDKDAIHVNTGALTDIPKGYEPIVVGDIEIKNGWIYVELQKVAEKPDKPEKPLINGLYQGSDGVWRYYVNSIFQKDFSGILEYEGNSFVLKEGVLCQDASGLNLIGDEWYYLTEGRIRTDVTQVVMYDGEWFYVSEGKLDTSVNGLVPYDGETFVFVDGRLAQEGNGLWVGEEGVWYFLSNGRVAKEHTGVAMYDNEWFYVVDGKIAVDYNGTVEYNGGTFKVVAGMLREQIK